MGLMRPIGPNAPNSLYAQCGKATGPVKGRSKGRLEADTT